MRGITAILRLIMDAGFFSFSCLVFFSPSHCENVNNNDLSVSVDKSTFPVVECRAVEQNASANLK